jgi:ABC-type transport system involved in multi-copper enzyme maturation permease subunit
MNTTVITRRPERGGYRFTDVARMEWVKLRTLRSTGWITLILAAGMLGLAVLVLSQEHYAYLSAADRASFDPTEQGFVGLALGQLLMAVLGALTITSEFSSGMIRATLAAAPRRPMVLAAKAAVLGVAGLAVGEVLAFGAFLAGQAALASPAPRATLAQPGVLRAVLMAGAYLCLLGLIGLGIGAIIRHTAGAIAAAVGVVFVLPVIFLVFPAGPQHGVEKFLPEIIAENSLTAVKHVSPSLPPWTGLGVLALYAAVTLAAGGWLLARRDTGAGQ